MRKRIAGGASGLCVAFAIFEGQHWLAARRYLPEVSARTTGLGADVLLVLGYPSRPMGLHPIQKWRTDIAVRSMDSCSDVLVITGGSRKNGRCEAEDMAQYARDRHQMPPGQMVIETEARSTWQNIEHSLPQLEEARTIKIASSPMHAARGRAYLAKQRPDLVGRLRPADDFRLGEHPVLKAMTVAYYGGLLLRQELSRFRSR